MLLTLLGLTLLVFLMLRLIPGTVVEQLIGADAVVSPAMVAELRRFFGLDQPWWLQYSRWLSGLVVSSKFTVPLNRSHAPLPIQAITPSISSTS